jgi:hypothetical protein
VEFDGSGDYLQTPDSEIFSLEKNDYTIEGWFYFTTLSATQRLFGQRAADASERQMLMETNASGELTYYFDISNSPKTVGGVVATQINTWHHIAVVRKNLVHTLYVDGVSVATNSTDTGTLENRSQPFSIGRQGNYTSDAFNGHISNFRICKGTAVYTSDFTVPTHALEVTQDTVLLCCNNPDSVTASDHGVVGAAPPTLTANGDPTVSSINPGLTRDFTYGTEFNGVTTFDTQGYFVPPSGTTEQRGRGRGVFGGSYLTPEGADARIEYIETNSLGNSFDFGDMSSTQMMATALADSTRSCFAGGIASPVTINTIEFVTIATTSNTTNFGDLSETKRHMGSCASNTKGVWAGGTTTTATACTTTLDNVTIQSLGTAVDYGDLSAARRSLGGASSPTRGVFAAGNTNTPTPTSAMNIIDYITIASGGTAQDFGDRTVTLREIGASSDSTRMVMGGGYEPANSDAIDYITIATTGNAQNFGDLTLARTHPNGMSNSIRGLFCGGSISPVYSNAIDYVTIQSTGNATDFGDLIKQRLGYANAACDSHGGLS